MKKAWRAKTALKRWRTDRMLGRKRKRGKDATISVRKGEALKRKTTNTGTPRTCGGRSGEEDDGVEGVKEEKQNGAGSREGEVRGLIQRHIGGESTRTNGRGSSKDRDRKV